MPGVPATVAEGQHTARDGGLIERSLRVVRGVEDGLLVLILAVLVVLAAAQIVLRNLAGSGILWADPALRVLVLWVGMAGALAATRDDRQITVDVVARWAPRRWRAAIRILTDSFTAGVCALLAWHGVRPVSYTHLTLPTNREV